VEFARQLAPQATALLLVARREDLLKTLATELTTQHPKLKVYHCAADLTTEQGRKNVRDTVVILDLKPQLIINNAGMGDYGSFSSASAERLKSQLDLNIGAVVMLTHMLLPEIQRPGAICNVSSLAGNLPMPDMAVYAASKAFVTSFSEALHLELAQRNITVTAVCPGPTPTSFSKTAKRDDGEDINRKGQNLLRISPQQVVSEGLAAVASGKACVFPGTAVSIAATLFRILPRRLIRWLNERR
jgi:short-subunit dehydrogenase